MYKKFKYILKDDAFFYMALILLVGIASFGLGRYSVSKTQPPMTHPAVSVQHGANVQASQPKVTSEKQYVASKNGSKYHLLTCPGASQIKDENKVFFATVDEARAQGYEPAANCVGL